MGEGSQIVAEVKGPVETEGCCGHGEEFDKRGPQT